MAGAFPTVDEVLDRVEFNINDIGDDAEEVRRFIQANLEDLIIEARTRGLDAWDDDTMPPVVAKQIRSAMVRFLRRPDGYIQSRAGDETLSWAEEHGHGGTPAFTEDEVDLIQQAATPGKAKVGTIATNRFGPMKSVEASIYYAPIFGHWDRFPYARVNDEGEVIVP